MPSCKWAQRLQKISGRKRDLLVIILGILLGTSTQYLSTHIWKFGNIFVNMLCYGCTVQEQQTLCAYWETSRLGVAIELVVLIIVIVVLVLFFSHDDDDKVINAIDRLGDNLGGKLDRIEKKIGGGNATTESETSKKEANKTKGKKKSRKA